MSRAGDGDLVSQAVAGDRAAFDRLVMPYRTELQVHCYRMLGSLHDAEDLVQDTLLRAWQALSQLEQRSSVRAWLYKIATNSCLNHLRRRPRLVVPADYGGAAPGPVPAAAEISWLEPFPDRLLRDAAADPAEQAGRRMTTSLAFLTAVQLLTARQRAVLILRDVLAFSTAEVAELLDATTVAVDSTLRRARRRLAVGARDPLATSGACDADEHSVVRAFVAAWERADVDALVMLLTDDAVLAMPPAPLWFRGRAAIGEFLSTVPAEGHLERIRLVETRANGQPALAAYAPDPARPVLTAYGVMVLDLDGSAIAALTGFANPALFADFALPQELPL